MNIYTFIEEGLNRKKNRNPVCLYLYK